MIGATFGDYAATDVYYAVGGLGGNGVGNFDVYERTGGVWKYAAAQVNCWGNGDCGKSADVDVVDVNGIAITAAVLKGNEYFFGARKVGNEHGIAAPLAGCWRKISGL